jgi:hypothetical protein
MTKKSSRKIEIVSIHNPRDTDDRNSEYVELLVLEATNLGMYAIVDNTYDKDGKPSNKFRHIFTFPQTVVKAFDIVRLYSGEGKNTIVPNKTTQINTYLFYWEADNFVWNNDTKDEAHLIMYAQIDKYKL